jgi:hypothetical protein
MGHDQAPTVTLTFGAKTFACPKTHVNLRVLRKAPNDPTTQRPNDGFDALKVPFASKLGGLPQKSE